MKVPFVVQDAVARYIEEGDKGISWIWFICANKEDHKKFEQWLVETKHPLSTEAGTPEQRFFAVVRELGKTKRAEREAKKSLQSKQNEPTPINGEPVPVEESSGEN